MYAYKTQMCKYTDAYIIHHYCWFEISALLIHNSGNRWKRFNVSMWAAQYTITAACMFSSLPRHHTSKDEVVNTSIFFPHTSDNRDDNGMKGESGGWDLEYTVKHSHNMGWCHLHVGSICLACKVTLENI